MRSLTGLLMVKTIETAGIIFKIKRFSVHDGPGIRTSIFMKGCPLNCIWCHSPEGISSDITIWYSQNLCITCGDCVRSCPEKALSLIADPVSRIFIDRSLCIVTGDCVRACPTGAMQFTGQKLSVADVIREIEKDINFYTTSGGGVTLTGGEPLNQPDFSLAILRSCREKNIHTAIESCLFCERDILSGVIDYIDQFIVDIKIFDNETHIRYTGRSNELIKENFRFIAERGKKITVRIPMVDKITNTEENIRSVTDFVNSVRSDIEIEQIEYNPLAGNNYARLGIPFLLR
jgi:pyruvate formate lyase activating enzyme